MRLYNKRFNEVINTIKREIQSGDCARWNLSFRDYLNERFGDLDLVEALKDEDDEAGHATSELFAHAARELRVYKHAYAMHGGIKAQVNE